MTSVGRAALFRLATNVRFERLVRTLPQVEHLAWRKASRYVAGTTSRDAFGLVRELQSRGLGASIDQFGELVGDARVAARATSDYLRLADDLAGLPESAWLSVDLTHLGLDVDRTRCAASRADIAQRLPAGRRIQVGAEDCDHADAVLDCVDAVCGDGLADRLGATVQANLRRAPAHLDRLLSAGVHIRLVKGAYIESAALALPYGEATDIAYLQLAHRLAESDAQFALATHDGVLREALLAAVGPLPIEQLLGVRPAVLDDLVARGLPTRVYVPFGTDWFRYWMRRFAESRG